MPNERNQKARKDEHRNRERNLTKLQITYVVLTLGYNLLATILISSGLHAFWKSVFQTKHENIVCVCGLKYSPRFFKIFLELHVFTVLGSYCKVSSCHFAECWASYGDRHQMGHYSCTTAWMWKLCALVLQEACLAKFHFTELTSNLFCCSWAKLQWQATGISVWVRKQWGSLTVLPAHVHQPSFSNTDTYSFRLHQGNSSTLPNWADKETVKMLSNPENSPHKHLISLEVLS